MMRKAITHIRYPVLIAVIVLCLFGVAQAATGNIDAVDKWAWGTNVGWINFNPEHGGVTVYADHLEGYAWGENIGWIRMGSHEGGGTHTYANTTQDNYGVNRDADGNLSGYAWGSNVGWINFNPTHSQVTIDPAGSFDGYAWGENVGWIHFKNAAPAYNVLITSRATVQAATGSGVAEFASRKGVIEDLTAIAEETLPCPAEGKPDLDFRHGFFSFNITGLTPCASETVVITITLPSAVPVGTQYWKCHDGAWLDVTSLLGDDDGDNVLTLTLTDGGLGDDDGECNGEIVDPGGPGQQSAKTLTVNRAGGGSGTVTSDPAGINCGADCTEDYLKDTVVTLTAHPGVKSYLASWSGDCVSTGALTAQVTMDADKTCTAAFSYPVGGIVVPVDKVGLLAPGVRLAVLAGLAVLGVVLVRRRRG
jgi:hypothetical protein